MRWQRTSSIRSPSLGDRNWSCSEFTLFPLSDECNFTRLRAFFKIKHGTCKNDSSQEGFQLSWFWNITDIFWSNDVFRYDEHVLTNTYKFGVVYQRNGQVRNNYFFENFLLASRSQLQVSRKYDTNHPYSYWDAYSNFTCHQMLIIKKNAGHWGRNVRQCARFRRFRRIPVGYWRESAAEGIPGEIARKRVWLSSANAGWTALEKKDFCRTKISLTVRITDRAYPYSETYPKSRYFEAEIQNYLGVPRWFRHRSRPDRSGNRLHRVPRTRGTVDYCNHVTTSLQWWNTFVQLLVRSMMCL